MKGARWMNRQDRFAYAESRAQESSVSVALWLAEDVRRTFCLATFEGAWSSISAPKSACGVQLRWGVSRARLELIWMRCFRVGGGGRA